MLGLYTKTKVSNRAHSQPFGVSQFRLCVKYSMDKATVDPTHPNEQASQPGRQHRKTLKVSPGAQKLDLGAQSGYKNFAQYVKGLEADDPAGQKHLQQSVRS